MLEQIDDGFVVGADCEGDMMLSIPFQKNGPDDAEIEEDGLR